MADCLVKPLINSLIRQFQIVSVSINNPETGDEQKITNLTNPFNLTFQTGKPSSGKTLRCYYYNKITAQWSSDGITSLVVGEQLQCLSSHLTSFSPAEVKENGTQTGKSSDLKQNWSVKLVVTRLSPRSDIGLVASLLSHQPCCKSVESSTL